MDDKGIDMRAEKCENAINFFIKVDNEWKESQEKIYTLARLTWRWWVQNELHMIEN